MRRVALGLLALAAVAPLVAAHAGHEGGLDRALTVDGARVQLGSWDAPQPGPVIVVPFEGGAIACGAPSGYLVDLGEGAGVSFASNATRVAATFDVAPPAFVAFAVDTHDAVRTLAMMREQAVALHALVAAIAQDANVTAKAGELGVPYDVPGASAHAMADAADEDAVRMAYDAPRAPLACAAPSQPGHVTLAWDRASLASTAPGSLVHVVALVDARVPGYLPHPVASTRVLQANLYLAKQDEDAGELRAALATGPSLAGVLPLVGTGAGLAAIVLVKRP